MSGGIAGTHKVMAGPKTDVPYWSRRESAWGQVPVRGKKYRLSGLHFFSKSLRFSADRHRSASHCPAGRVGECGRRIRKLRWGGCTRSNISAHVKRRVVVLGGWHNLGQGSMISDSAGYNETQAWLGGRDGEAEVCS